MSVSAIAPVSSRGLGEIFTKQPEALTHENNR